MSKITVELPETFFEGEQEVRKPSFRQKAALAELQALCFLQVKTSDYVPGFKRLIRATASVVDCEDFSEELKSNLHHPLFWRALGFYSEDPMVNFKYYHEPKGGHGQGTVSGLSGDKMSNKKQTNNMYPELPLNPLTSRFGGGLLTMNCLLYFFESQRSALAAKTILRKRQQRHVHGSLDHYMFIVVAFELVRVLALTFSIVETRDQEVPNHPIQPDTRCMAPFAVSEVR